MVKHVSVFTLKDKSQISKMVEMLKEVQATCNLIIDGEIGVNYAESKGGMGPEFGDIIQIISFNTKEDLDIYPTTPEHTKLVVEGPEMEKVTAIDYVVE